jgi:hypothetical protein
MMPINEVENPQSVPAAEIAERDDLIAKLEAVLSGHHHAPALNALGTVTGRVLANLIVADPEAGPALVKSFSESVQQIAMLEARGKLNS